LSVASFFLADIPLPPRVATALLYGIETELAGYPREASALDDSAIQYLFPLADKDLLAKIRNAPLPQGYFECVLQALQSSFIYDKLLISWVNELPQPEMAAQVVDFMIRYEDIDWAVCAGVYQDKQPPDQPEAIAEVASNPQPGQKLVFEISGEGTLKSQDEQASNQVSGPAASTDNRPGGGLGPPIEAPDPLDKYRTLILVGFGAVLVVGAIYITQRSRSSHAVPVAASSQSGKLLDALKEELFQLEVEHKQGQITDQEYARVKAALDQTLARAIKRSH
jgi:hypothetical protein